MFGVRVVYAWCMCGVLLVWVDVSWAVFVVYTLVVLVCSGCMMCMFQLCVA